MGWRNFSKTAEKKFVQPTRSGCSIRDGEDDVVFYGGLLVQFYLEEPIRLPSPHRINFSVCLSVCLSVCSSICPSIWNMKTRRIFTQELKSGCPREVFCPSSIPSKYLFLCARRKFGFNKKICTKLLIVYVYFQPNSCNTHADRE